MRVVLLPCPASRPAARPPHPPPPPTPRVPSRKERRKLAAEKKLAEAETKALADKKELVDAVLENCTMDWLLAPVEVQQVGEGQGPEQVPPPAEPNSNSNPPQPQRAARARRNISRAWADKHNEQTFDLLLSGSPALERLLRTTERSKYSTRRFDCLLSTDGQQVKVHYVKVRPDAAVDSAAKLPAGQKGKKRSSAAAPVPEISQREFDRWIAEHRTIIAVDPGHVDIVAAVRHEPPPARPSPGTSPGSHWACPGPPPPPRGPAPSLRQPPTQGAGRDRDRGWVGVRVRVRVRAWEQGRGWVLGRGWGWSGRGWGRGRGRGRGRRRGRGRGRGRGPMRGLGLRG